MYAFWCLARSLLAKVRASGTAAKSGLGWSKRAVAEALHPILSFALSPRQHFTPPPLIHNHLLDIRKDAEEVRPLSLQHWQQPLGPHTNTDALASGIASAALRASLKSRPAAVQRAFIPAVAQRLASTQTAQAGQIHQVIGAVVDGMSPPPASSLLRARRKAGPKSKSQERTQQPLTTTHSQVRRRAAPGYPQCPHHRQWRPDSDPRGRSM